MVTTLRDDEIAAWAAEQTCPRCGNAGFRVEWRLATIPHGRYSLAGVQTKFAATRTPFIVCGLDAGVSAGAGCGAETVGRR